MSEKVKLYKHYSGDYVLYTDHQSTRQALADTKAQLEALEDAIMYERRSDFTKQEKNNGLEIYTKLIHASKIIERAIANSRARKQKSKNIQIYYNEVKFNSLEDFLFSFKRKFLHLPMYYNKLPTVEKIYDYLYKHYPEVFL